MSALLPYLFLQYTGKHKVKLGAHEVPVFTRMVKKERLKKVVRRNKWRVNNKSDVSPDPPPVEEIISRAAACIGKEVIYYSFSRNGEHFVTKLRYGQAVSEQVSGTGCALGSPLYFALSCDSTSVHDPEILATKHKSLLTSQKSSQH